MLVILLGEERERENGGTERRLKFRRSSNSLSLSFLCCCLLFTNERKKRVVVVESLFVEVLFRSLFGCARDFTSSPGVCDATLKREINFKQKKNVIWRELRST